MRKGYLSIVLHSHLPFVRHPEHESFLEEDWLFEAMIGTYIPLIQVFTRLANDKVPFRLTISCSPTLVAMLQDPLLQERFNIYLEERIELSEKEIYRTRNEPQFQVLAKMYNKQFKAASDIFNNLYKKDLIKAFKEFQDRGFLEIITCGATHGFHPLMNDDKRSYRGQIITAVKDYERCFGRPPKGFWLPECGYVPGADEVLAEGGIKFFFVDTHAVLYGSHKPFYGIFAPIVCPSGVAAFGRDPESSKQVWSAKEGYPGDFDYRDFYRDVGFDLDYDYIAPYLHGDGHRVNLGIKYYRITGKTDRKEPYNLDVARERAATHAGNFMFNRERQIEFAASIMDRKPIIISPYDAELYGHWWYEGPMWLEFLFRKIAYDQSAFDLITPSDYLEEYPVNQQATPSPSSWGYQGYNEVWLNGSNDWIYKHLHAAVDRMGTLADKFPNADGITRRVLTQAGRELLLAQASDWAFIMKTGTLVDYAVRRTKTHLARFTKLFEDLLSGSIDQNWLAAIEDQDSLFPNIDYRVWASR